MTVRGWLRTARHSKNVSFLEVTDGSSFAGIQAVAAPELPNYEGTVALLSTGCASWRSVGRYEHWTLYETPGNAVSVERYEAAFEPAFEAVSSTLGPFKRRVRVHAWHGAVSMDGTDRSVIGSKRFLLQRRVIRKADLTPPTQQEGNVNRPVFKVMRASFNPWPSCQSKFSFGIRTFSNFIKPL